MKAKRNLPDIFNKVKSISNQSAYKTSLDRFSESGEVNFYSSIKKSKVQTKRAGIIMRRFLTKKGKVLDVGCAAGRISYLLAKNGFNVKAIDFSQGMINSAKRRYKLKNLIFQKKDILDLKEKNKYDYVLALFNLLTYFPSYEQRKKALRIMIDALKPNGLLVADVINKFGSLRILSKVLFFKFLFILSLKNRPFGDLFSNPTFSNSKEILFQHYFSRRELENLLSEFKDIKYEIRNFSIFTDKKSSENLLLLIRKQPSHTSEK